MHHVCHYFFILFFQMLTTSLYEWAIIRPPFIKTKKCWCISMFLYGASTVVLRIDETML
jgi:hypothetical protein